MKKHRHLTMSFVVAVVLHGIALIVVGNIIICGYPRILLAVEKAPAELTFTILQNQTLAPAAVPAAQPAPPVAVTPTPPPAAKVVRVEPPLPPPPAPEPRPPEPEVKPQPPVPTPEPPVLHPPAPVVLPPPPVVPAAQARLALAAASVNTGGSVAANPATSHATLAPGMVAGSGSSGRSEGPNSGIELVTDIRPPYPLDARKRGEEGTVVLRTRIDSAGRPRDIEVAQSSGFSSLDEAAKAAARKARFRASAGQQLAPASETTLTFRFNLLD